jgi:hypothetical protein
VQEEISSSMNKVSVSACGSADKGWLNAGIDERGKCGQLTPPQPSKQTPSPEDRNRCVKKTPVGKKATVRCLLLFQPAFQ